MHGAKIWVEAATMFAHCWGTTALANYFMLSGNQQKESHTEAR